MNGWQPELPVLAGLLAVQIGYLLCVGPGRHRFTALEGRGAPPPVGRGQQASFVLGILTLGLALATPLDALAGVLLSLHMVQHLLLTLVAPPLLLLGTPGWLLRPALGWPGVAAAARVVTRPPLAFAIGNVTFAVWHVPALYDAALQAHPIHVVEHVSFIASAAIMWWPLTSRLPELPRLSPPLQMLYTLLQVLPGALIGIILAMASGPLYPTYAATPRPWGLSPQTDQQIAGLIMWVGTNLFWLAVLTAVFFAWAAREEADGAPGSRQAPVAGRR